jgi:hypothetical protein
MLPNFTAKLFSTSYLFFKPLKTAWSIIIRIFSFNFSLAARHFTVIYILLYIFFNAKRVRYTQTVSFCVSLAFLAAFCHLVTFFHACHKFFNLPLNKNNVPNSPWKFYVLLTNELWRVSFSVLISINFAVCALIVLYIGLRRHLLHASLSVSFLYIRLSPIQATFWALVSYLSFANALMFKKPFYHILFVNT